MKRLLTALFTMAMLASCSHIRPSGNIITEIRDVNSFREVYISGGLSASIEYATDGESVVIRADDNVLPYIRTSVRQGQLRIEFERGIHIGGRPTIKIRVNASELEGVLGSGGSKVSCDWPEYIHNFEVALSGGSRMTFLGDARTMSVNLSGGSDFEGSGYIERLNTTCSGGSKLTNYDLQADSFKGNLSGGSKAKITVHESINLDASGGSKLYYKGSPAHIEKNLSGGSDLTQVR